MQTDLQTSVNTLILLGEPVRRQQHVNASHGDICTILEDEGASLELLEVNPGDGPRPATLPLAG
ncbi:hypothetical protein RUR49_08100 [Pseudoxanthobacter sp. M-2]|uniref:hypothetical protein n=1 Tax=Pseudoxanthobacter sp. M-2 TaxID=3078754 RepID=UPI0038FC8D00